MADSQDRSRIEAGAGRAAAGPALPRHGRRSGAAVPGIAEEGGGQMIKTLPAPTPIRQDGIAQYLLGLAALCIEVARRPALLPLFLRIIKLAPRTIETLWTERRAA